MGCTPTPIDVSAARDVTITWLSHTESVLVLDWANSKEQQQQQRRVQATRETTSHGPATKAAATELCRAAIASPISSSARGATAAEDSSDDARRAQGLVPLRCDYTPFPTHRSSGLVFALPPSSTSGGPTGAAAEAPALESVPVGGEYYTALQRAWSAMPEQPPSLLPLATESEVDMADIDDVLSGDSDYEELWPPVPLGLMISYFAVDWRESGLYENVQRQDASQAQGKTR
ncbi:hypothetical protein NESM_000349400 [Novymonas esmeraldas]|uniref:Uncharacterized protein n=1 Tax=Novymonas esmeraldas TaxID=1808958 RepID=A0AAW0EL33_9TRYP